jgi:hypothetical protein
MQILNPNLFTSMWPEDNVMPLSTQTGVENLPSSIDKVRGMQREMWFPPFSEREKAHLLVKETLISPFSFSISPLSEWRGKRTHGCVRFS